MKTLLLAAALGMVSTAALAATYTYDYSASFSSRTYDATRVSLTDTIQAMGTITGQITLDDTVIIEFSPNQIRYVAPIITIDGIDMSLFERLPSSLTVYNDSANSDALRVGTPSYSSDMDGRYINSLSFNFLDDSKTALSDASLPISLNLGDWRDSILYVDSLHYSRGVPSSTYTERDRVTFQFDSLTPVTPVPLPAGIWLLSAGLAGLGMVRRRKRG
ncbi:VPLPA-CTERM sorting domain-containing protein [Roseovarius sp. ZX-A-9]|uniref:VPLPA-CTERM sorting domain-containing protein n=1 Tax=Roseovarius sp. ZX-A-9 TaxID=3014783 RepID=UPI00232F3A5E|nr:VPLPA-CTERM sorting domain-containing protein [Roseovarius sp. ZX-A-9]